MIPIRVTSVNLKPLIPVGLKFDSQKVLKSLSRQVLKVIKGKILQETFSARAKRALSEGMKVKLGPNSITVMATHPAFIPLLQGQRMGQMKWLVKAQAPIPIVTDDGELIFRSATPKSMQDGKWVHPGRQPTTVLERAKKEARLVLKKKLGAELRKQFRMSLAK